jgi:hypothetical protein
VATSASGLRAEGTLDFCLNFKATFVTDFDVMRAVFPVSARFMRQKQATLHDNIPRRRVLWG